MSKQSFQQFDHCTENSRSLGVCWGGVTV